MQERGILVRCKTMREQPNQVNPPLPTDLGVPIEQYPGIPPPVPTSRSLRSGVKQDEPAVSEHPNPNHLMWHSLIIGMIMMSLSLITKANPVTNWLMLYEKINEVFTFPFNALIINFGIMVMFWAVIYGIIAGAVSVAIYYRGRRPVTTLILGLLGLLLNLVVAYSFVDAWTFSHYWF